MRIKLGDRVRDVVTEFVGVATTVADHLTGCRRYWVEGKVDDKGNPVGQWVDESRLEVVGEPVTLRQAEVAERPAPANVGAPSSIPRPR